MCLFAQGSADEIAVIELRLDRLVQKNCIKLGSLKLQIEQAERLDLTAEGRTSLAEATWQITKLSWSADATLILIIRRPDPAQVCLSGSMREAKGVVWPVHYAGSRFSQSLLPIRNYKLTVITLSTDTHQLFDLF